MSIWDTPARRLGAAAPGVKVGSIWPTSVAADHEQSAGYQCAGRLLHVFKTRGEQVAISFGCLGDEEVIRLSRYDTRRGCEGSRNRAGPVAIHCVRSLLRTGDDRPGAGWRSDYGRVERKGTGEVAFAIEMPNAQRQRDVRAVGGNDCIVALDARVGVTVRVVSLRCRHAE